MAQDLRSPGDFTVKSDGSLVTKADPELERWLRPLLLEALPGSAIWGEELGWSEPGPEGLWMIDPVDGTSNYAFGSPLWGVSVALFRHGHLELGAVAMPDFQELYLARRGAGATLNGEPMPRFRAGEIQPFEIVSHNDGLPQRYPNEIFPGKVRYTGCIVFDGVYVATQRFRGLIDDKCKLYDVAAVVTICRELGADVRYADGSEFIEADLLANRRIGKPYVIFPLGSSFRMSPEARFPEQNP